MGRRDATKSLTSSRTSLRTLLATLAAALLILPGCGAGEAVRPDAIRGAAALGESGGTCPTPHSTPLVVDWKADERADLEVAMQHGVAVVSYTCTGIKLRVGSPLGGSTLCPSVRRPGLAHVRVHLSEVPSPLANEVPNTPLYLVSDLADVLHGLALRVVQGPVVAFDARRSPS
jgi:hypothetical protein